MAFLVSGLLASRSWLAMVPPYFYLEGFSGDLIPMWSPHLFESALMFWSPKRIWRIARL